MKNQSNLEYYKKVHDFYKEYWSQPCCSNEIVIPDKKHKYRYAYKCESCGGEVSNLGVIYYVYKQKNI